MRAAKHGSKNPKHGRRKAEIGTTAEVCAVCGAHARAANRAERRRAGLTNARVIEHQPHCRLNDAS